MNDTSQGCAIKCWIAAGVIGLIVLLMSISVGGHSFLTGVVLGIVAVVLLGFMLTWLFCAPSPKAGQSADRSPVEAAAHASGAAAGATGAAVAGAAAVAADKATDAGTAARKTAAEAAETVSDAAADTVEAVSDAADAAVETAKDATDDAADGAAQEAADAETGTPADAAPEAPGDTAGQIGSGVKPSTPLAGEEDLASRKGSWSYQGETGGAAAAAPASTASSATSAEDLDTDGTGDGTAEGTDEGTKPETLSAARDGQADDLKEIKGVGPKMETMLNEMGFFHFDQIANWTESEVAWVNANLQGFKGRVSRDNWVEQARILASGGETEFSKRARDGDVY